MPSTTLHGERQNLIRLDRQVRGVSGWLTREALGLFLMIDEFQKEHGVEGDIFEIGAHHGKSAAVLAAMARPAEELGICDLFESQSANVSASGWGDRQICLANIRRVVPGFERLRVYEQHSSTLVGEELPQPCRFFHIDGGHLVEEALGDLFLACDALHEQGVIVLDDPFRPDWPGVTEAVIRFLGRRDDFAPICVGFNKLVLARRPAASLYVQRLSDIRAVKSYSRNRAIEIKRLPFAGDELLIYFVPTARTSESLARKTSAAMWAYEGLRRRLDRSWVANR